ncbi:exported hypothetical protein [Candidatus Zixiibacteriota bacterium]|nr:exported hypothetical protein [candidate division Zixibacteria bacterium]
MSFSPRSLKLSRLFAVAILLLLAGVSSGFAQIYPDLEVEVRDTTAYPGTQNSVISVYMRNYADTVAGFELWLQLSRTDRAIFQTNIDTVIDTTYYRCTQWNGSTCLDTVIASWYWVCTQYSGSTCVDSSYQLGYYRCTNYHLPDSVCLDSVWVPGYDWRVIDTQVVHTGNFDTTGTLISGWEYIQSRSLGGSGYDIKITAQANTAPPPYHKGIGFPQYGTKPLIKLLADVYPLPDSVLDRTVKIAIQAHNLDNFSFSRQDGSSIGVISYYVPDTSWFVCQAWDGSNCLLWEKVQGPPADSFHVDSLLTGKLDSTKVALFDGTLSILQGLCGDVNNNGVINILDVSYLINFLYKHGPALPNPYLADCNGKAGLNILDVSYIINFIYKHGPAPICL